MLDRILIILFIAVLVFGFTTADLEKVISIYRVPMKTTRDNEFQDDYEKAKREYDDLMWGVPPGLVLPNGYTIDEQISHGIVDK